MTDAFSPDSPDRRHGASSLTARASRPKSSAASTAPAPGGGWWYELRLPIWADVQLPDRITVEPDSVVFRLPARLATSIEDTTTPPFRLDGNAHRPDRPAPSLTAPAGRWSVHTCPRPPAAAGAASSTMSRAGYRPAARTSRSTRCCASSLVRAARHVPPARPATSRDPEAAFLRFSAGRREGETLSATGRGSAATWARCPALSPDDDRCRLSGLRDACSLVTSATYVIGPGHPRAWCILICAGESFDHVSCIFT